MADTPATKKIARKSSKAAAGEKESDAASEPDLPFEAALAALEDIVAQMEGGDLSLDESLAAFERGVALTRQCQQALQAAELKVQALTEDGTLTPVTLDDLDEPGDD